MSAPYESRIVPGNPERRKEAAEEDRKRSTRASLGSTGMGQPMTWAGFSKGVKWPDHCDTCGRKRAWMRALEMGDAECAHVECPHRHKLTACGSGFRDGSSV